MTRPAFTMRERDEIVAAVKAVLRRHALTPRAFGNFTRIARKEMETERERANG
jgi:hypothetical protein